jgi:homoserine kinase
VPASTSNLGAGFDCIGLALDRYLDVEFTPGGPDLIVERRGTLADLEIPVDDDILLRTLREEHRRRGVEAAGTLRATSSIPVARGLGSSAAAAVAGLALAAAALGNEWDDRAALGRVAALEGHPDNAAPAILGGLVAVATDANGALRAFRLPLAERIAFAYAAPAAVVSTKHARDALPQTVSHLTAVRALPRLAALLHGLATGDPELLRIGMSDDLHVPYRLPLIPRANQAMRAALDAGAWAVTISGSGSGLIAVCEPGREATIARAMADAFGAEHDDRVLAFATRPDPRGARVTAPGTAQTTG